MAFNNTSFYVNGSKITGNFTNSWSTMITNNLTGSIQVGSSQGTTRSISTYNTYGIIDRMLTDEELAELTSI